MKPGTIFAIILILGLSVYVFAFIVLPIILKIILAILILAVVAYAIFSRFEKRR